MRYWTHRWGTEADLAHLHVRARAIIGWILPRVTRNGIFGLDYSKQVVHSADSWMGRGLLGVCKGLPSS